MTAIKRILYVQRPSGGGSATGLLDLLRYLDRDRYKPVVLCYTPGPYTEAYADLGAEICHLDEVAGGRIPRGRGATRRVMYEFTLSKRIASVLRAQGVDLVHHNNNPRSNWASILAATRLDLPQVCHVRMLNRYWAWLDRPLARAVDGYLYVSRGVEEECRRELGISSGRGQVLDDPVDLEGSTRARDARGRVRAALGIGEREIVCTNVGRLVPWKGQDFFLQAFARVAGQHPDTRALIVGSADDKQTSRAFAQRLREMVDTLGLAERVHFLGFRRDVAALMAASDIVVHSASEPEPFGRVVIEAMAAGVPVIATAAGGPLEVVEDGRTGRLVPMRDAEAMAGAILHLAADPEGARRMGRRAHYYAQQRFNPERFIATVHGLYEDLLAPRRARSPRAARQLQGG